MKGRANACLGIYIAGIFIFFVCLFSVLGVFCFFYFVNLE